MYLTSNNGYFPLQAQLLHPDCTWTQSANLPNKPNKEHGAAHPTQVRQFPLLSSPSFFTRNVKLNILKSIKKCMNSIIFSFLCTPAGIKCGCSSSFATEFFYEYKVYRTLRKPKNKDKFNVKSLYARRCNTCYHKILTKLHFVSRCFRFSRRERMIKL